MSYLRDLLFIFIVIFIKFNRIKTHLFFAYFLECAQLLLDDNVGEERE